MRISALELPATQAEEDGLVELLRDSVDDGASVGFLPPLTETAAHEWAQGVLTEAAAGRRIILVARDGAGIVGCAHLALAHYPNGRHRAEVQKVLVHTRARRQGTGEALMRALEPLALAHGRTLLVLDTLEGSDASRLYRRLGYVEVGVIPRFALISEDEARGTVVFYRELDQSLDK